MAEWSRETPWRQCHFLPPGFAHAAGLISNDNEVVVLVSHSCDIAQLPDAEPEIEIIKGYIITKADGNSTHGKNARILHIEAKQNGQDILIEFRANEKQRIQKDMLLNCAPDPDHYFGQSQQRTFQQWLAARYRRSAFPTEFDARLTNTKLGEKIKRKLAAYESTIRAIYVDIDKGVEIRRPANEPYELKIFLVYDVEEDPDAAKAAAEKLCKELQDEFQKLCFKDGKWENFELVQCITISAAVFSVRMTYMLQRWTLDYLSLRSDSELSE